MPFLQRAAAVALGGLAALSLSVSPALADVPGGLGDGNGDGKADLWGTIADGHYYKDTVWNGHTQMYESYLGGIQWYPTDPVTQGVKIKPVNPNRSTTNGIPYGEPELKMFGWGSASAIAPLPDVNGDKKSDHMVRFGSQLFFYFGDGKGNFTKGPEIGHGWGQLDNLTYAGDLNGDGTRYLLGRNVTDAKLYAYKLNASGGVSDVGVVGKGWGAMRFILGPGQLVGDKKADLAAIDTSGRMWCYPGTGGGHIADAKQCGMGWNGFEKALIAGDMDGDGRYDLVSVKKVTHPNSQGEPVAPDNTSKDYSLRAPVFYYKNLGNGTWGDALMVRFDFYRFAHLS